VRTLQDLNNLEVQELRSHWTRLCSESANLRQGV